MAVLETIRVKIGWLITALIAIALLSFIVDFNSLFSSLQGLSPKYNVGKINGKNVSSKDFQERMDFQNRIYDIQGMRNSGAEDMQTYASDEVWNHFIYQNLFVKMANEAGIEVGENEVQEMASGDRLSMALVSDPLVGDPTFNGYYFNRERLNYFLDEFNNNGSEYSKLYWEYLQEKLQNARYTEKYFSLFQMSNLPNDKMVENGIEDGNTLSDAEYIMVPYSVLDSIVTPADVAGYHMSHLRLLTQPDNRDVEYAYFHITPSAEDIEAVRKDVEDLYDEFSATDNVRSFLVRKSSEIKFEDRYFKDGAIQPGKVNDFVFSHKDGVSDIISDGESFYVVRIMGQKVFPDQVSVSHILVEDDNALADSLYNVLKKQPSKFAELAALHSKDKRSVNGYLGEMTQDTMEQGLESLMTTPVNEPVIKDFADGRHIFMVTKASEPVLQKQVAILKKTAYPSKATLETGYKKAKELAVQAGGSLEGLRNAAHEKGIYLHSENIDESRENYVGVKQAREVTRWAFRADKGAASDVINLNSTNLFVVGVKEIHHEGVKNLNEAYSMIEPEVYAIKRSEKTLADVKAKIEGLTDLEEMASVLGCSVQAASDVSFSPMTKYDAYQYMQQNTQYPVNMYYAYQQYEPALVGAIAGSEPGKVSVPVAGRNGVYIVKVTARKTAGNIHDKEDVVQWSMLQNRQSSQHIVKTLLDATGSYDHRNKIN